MEKVIEDSTLFGQTLEGRFDFDAMRTILQSSIAAKVHLEAYMTWVMKMPDEVVRKSPQEFTPLAFAAGGFTHLSIGLQEFGHLH